MIHRESIPFRKMWLWCLAIASGLLTVYLGFICLVSVWIGLSHIHQPGFWVPLLAGLSFLIGLLWLFFRISRRILNHMKEEDLVNI